MIHPKVVEARKFAVKKHAGQEYGKGTPYVAHLDRVAALVSPCGPTAQVVAYLHDVLEDTDATRAEVRHFFGADIEHMVGIVSDPPGKSRRERKAALHVRLVGVQAPWFLALTVKIADRLCNLRAATADRRDLLPMYCDEHAAFRDAAQRQGWADAWWAEMEVLTAPGSPEAGLPQEELDPEAAKILSRELWDLYESEPAGRPAPGLERACRCRGTGEVGDDAAVCFDCCGTGRVRSDTYGVAVADFPPWRAP